MRIFKTTHFERFTQKHQISNQELTQLIQNMENGLIDANLGSGVYKQRLAKIGQGKSSGYRTIIIYKVQEIAFFVMGFEKSHKSNISPIELKELKKSADIYLNLTSQQILNLVLKQKLIEIPMPQGQQYD